jgi:hypothetical protein
MSSAGGLIAAAVAIQAANELVFAPVVGTKISFNWRLIPAGILGALAFDGLSKLSEPFATGLAGLCLFGSIFVQFGNAPAPITNVIKMMGY